MNLHANAISEGSIFLGSENSKVSLEAGKVLFDEIKQQNSTTMAIFYKVSKGTLHLNVHSGKVKVEMSYEDQKFEKSFIKNKKPYNESYEFTQIPGKFTPIQVKIFAEEVPAIYSLGLSPLIDNT